LLAYPVYPYSSKGVGGKCFCFLLLLMAAYNAASNFLNKGGFLRTLRTPVGVATDARPYRTRIHQT
jgi:hypothetical protein